MKTFTPTQGIRWGRKGQVKVNRRTPECSTKRFPLCIFSKCTPGTSTYLSIAHVYDSGGEAAATCRKIFAKSMQPKLVGWRKAGWCTGDAGLCNMLPLPCCLAILFRRQAHQFLDKFNTHSLCADRKK